jgi:hypothetical protein
MAKLCLNGLLCPGARGRCRLVGQPLTSGVPQGTRHVARARPWTARPIDTPGPRFGFGFPPILGFSQSFGFGFRDLSGGVRVGPVVGERVGWG